MELEGNGQGEGGEIRRGGKDEVQQGRKRESGRGFDQGGACLKERAVGYSRTRREVARWRHTKRQ